MLLSGFIVKLPNLPNAAPLQVTTTGRVDFVVNCKNMVVPNTPASGSVAYPTPDVYVLPVQTIILVPPGVSDTLPDVVPAVTVFILGGIAGLAIFVVMPFVLAWLGFGMLNYFAHVNGHNLYSIVIDKTLSF